MKKLLVILLSISWFWSYGQVPGDSSLAPSSMSRLNTFYTGSWLAAGTNTYTSSQAFVKLKKDKTYSIKFTNANTGTSTFNLNSGVATPLKKYNSSGSLVNLVTGDIWANQTSSWTFDGTNLVLQAPSSVSSGITNSAGNNILMKSDGTNAVSSGLTMTGSVMSGLSGFASFIGISGGGITPARFLEVEVNGSSTNTVQYPVRFDTNTSGTPANGTGVGIELSTKTTAGKVVGSTLESVSTDVTSASEDFDVTINTLRAGSKTEQVRFSSLGQIGLGGANYGTSGQVITSNGSSSAPTWQTPSGGGTTTNALSIGAELTSGGASSFNGSAAKTIGIQPSSVTNSMLAGSISNANLANSSITIAGNSTSLGGSVTQDNITGLSSTGIVKRTASNTLAIATSGTDYELPLTFTSPLSRATNTISIPVATSSANGYLSSTDWSTFNGKGAGTVTTASVVTANGVSATVANPTTTPAFTFTLGAINPTTVNTIAFSGASSPTLAVTGTSTISGTHSGASSGTNTGDQTITLTGAVTGSGTGSFATTIATPGTLTVSSTNSTATAHTHAITSSSAPGAAASLLSTDASGIIGSTGTRLTKGWFTDLTVTNSISGSITGTSGITNALKSASTTIDVSAATAPTSGQVLTATSSTAATWQNPAGAFTTFNVKNYGAVGDGVTNDYTAINNCIAASSDGDVIYFPTGTYVINTGLIITKKITFFGFGTVTIKNSTGILLIDMQSDYVKIEGITFNSTGTCIQVNNHYFWKINTCTFTTTGGLGGVYVTQTTGSDASGNVFNCNFINCNIGANLGDRGEYVTINGGLASGCGIGFLAAGGNHIINGVNINGCTTGIKVVSGTNNAHGIISNCNLNHDNTFNIDIEDETLGETIIGCHIYGAILYLKNANNVVIDGGIIDPSEFRFQNSFNCVIQNASFAQSFANTLTPNFGNTISDVRFINNIPTTPTSNLRYDLGAVGNRMPMGTSTLDFGLSEIQYVTLTGNTSITDIINPIYNKTVRLEIIPAGFTFSLLGNTAIEGYFSTTSTNFVELTCIDAGYNPQFRARVVQPSSVVTNAKSTSLNWYNGTATASISGSTISKSTGSSSTFDASAISDRSCNGTGFLQITANTTNGNAMIGFTQSAVPIAIISSFKYALYTSGTSVFTQEGGTTSSSIGTVASGNLLRINVTGTTVTYEKSTNGGSSWSVLSTSGTAATFPLKITALIRGVGDQFAGCLYSGSSINYQANTLNPPLLVPIVAPSNYLPSYVPSGSAVSLTTNTPINVTSISLPDGVWDVSGNVNYILSTATVTQKICSISTTSATQANNGSESYNGTQMSLLTATDGNTIARVRITATTATTVYLVAQSTFSVGSVSVFGGITASRVK